MEIFVCARAVVDQCSATPCLGFLTVWECMEQWMDGQRQRKDEEELYTAMMAASQAASRPLAEAAAESSETLFKSTALFRW